MSATLDPTDAFYSAFSGGLVRAACFVAVGTGGQFVGEQIHDSPTRFVALQSQGIRALFDWFEIDAMALPFNWVLTVLGSAFWWTFPLALLILFLFIAMWRDADLFSVLFVLALAQPIDTFIFQQRLSPLSGTDLALAIGLLIGFEVATGALLLWWRRTSNALPDPDTQPDTDEL